MIQLIVTKLGIASLFLLSLLLPMKQALAADNLYVFVFKNGAVQKDIVVNVGQAEKTTNEFGLANFALPAAEYEVGYYKNGELLR